MSDTRDFLLPDLGEGLPDATIVEWFVREGDTVRLDEPLVAMETAKAVVEVPAPVSGTVLKLAGGAGEVILTGHLLARFEADPSLPQRADGHDTGHRHGATAPATATDTPRTTAAPAPSASTNAGTDAGTVVGAMQSSDAVRNETAVAVGGVKAMPAVRAMAKKLGIDLSRIHATGMDGTVTLGDVRRAAEQGPMPAIDDAEPSAPAHAASPATSGHAAAAATSHAVAAPAPARTPLSASGKPMRTRPPGAADAQGQPEPLKGVRRNMARVMADAHAQVVPTTLTDDADLHLWPAGTDTTARLVRAIVVAARAVPALNAWFDGAALTRTLHPQVDVGIAVDTDDGLFVPVLRNADMLDGHGIRTGIQRLRAQVGDRSIAPSELSGATISLSNFGMFAGRYATPVVVPPAVAIVGAGRARHQLVPVMGGIETHKLLPISLSFDHRAATGGEGARFLRALLDDLALPG